MEMKAKQQVSPVNADPTRPPASGATFHGHPDEEKPVELRIGELLKDAHAGKPGEEVISLYRLKLYMGHK